VPLIGSPIAVTALIGVGLKAATPTIRPVQRRSGHERSVWWCLPNEAAASPGELSTTNRGPCRTRVG